MQLDTHQLDSYLIQKECYLVELNKLALRMRKEPRLWQNSPVIEGLTLGKILAEPDKTTDLIINQIASTNFEFQNPKVIELVTGTKTRKVTIYAWPERIILMVLQKSLTRALEKKFSKSLYSFIKGRNTLQAQLKLKKFLKKYPQAIIAKRDISAYGDTIIGEILYAQLAELINFNKNPASQKIIKSAIGNNLVGIPTGSPLTPFFENVYLMKLDTLFENLCEGKHFYARYGDDFVFSSLDPKWIEQAEAQSSLLIQELGLHVAEHKKTTLKFKDPLESVEWLGCAFKKNGLITSKQKHSAQVYNDFKKYFSHLISRLSKKSSIEVGLPIIQTALENFLSHRENPQLGKLLVHRNDPLITKTFDDNIKYFLVKWISKYFRINKRNAWQFVRKLNVPSLNYQRRFLYRLDKYE